MYEEVSAGGRDYLLVHAGLGNYSPEKEIEDYSLEELMWMRADYNVRYFDDVIVVTGHTPTQQIKDNPNPGLSIRRTIISSLTAVHIIRVADLPRYAWIQGRVLFFPSLNNIKQIRFHR